MKMHALLDPPAFFRHLCYDHFVAVPFSSVHNGWTTSAFLTFPSPSRTLIQLLFVQNKTYGSEVKLTLNFCVMQVSFERSSP